MSTYTSVNGTFTYTITNTSSYVFDSTDYAIIQSAFDRWDNIMTLDSRLGAGYTITISYSVDVLEVGILGGASIQTVGYIGSQTFGNTFPYEAEITLNAIYLSGMKNAVRSDGKTSYYYVLLHEIGHILGIGSFWNLPGTPKVSYLDNGVTKYYYTGANALREYKYYFTAMGSSSFVGVPIEDNGGAGTVNVHPEEGLEGGVSADNRYINGILHPGLDTELMTGWLDSAPVSTPLSRITLGFLADMGYTVNYNLADLYTMAAGSGTSSIDWASPTETILRASNLGAGDTFGNSVSISGNYAIVGAFNEDDTSTSTTFNSGAAYIFERDGSGNWTEKQILRASNLGEIDYFGGSVAISGNYAIVGANQEDGTSNSTSVNSGAAYIFERDGSGVWNEKQILRASNLDGGDQFGVSVAIDGNYAIVGAIQEDGSSTSTGFNSGAAYIFERDGSGNWTEKNILRASNFGVGDTFGISVAISGNYAIVGAFNEDDTSTSASFNCGAAYIFERDGSGNWIQNPTILRASNLGNSDNFGHRVAISGNYAIVGAFNEDDTSTSTTFNSGAAYIFERDGSGNWTEKTILRASNLGAGDYFGYSVAISGNYAIVGAFNEDDTSTSTTFNSGAAYIFERNASTGVWTEIKILQASNLDAGDTFGGSVAISGNYVIVGANNEDSSNTSTTFNSGAAYIYTASLVQSPTMTITSTTAGVTNGSTTNNASIELTFTSSEATTNFAVEDISVTNGTLSNFNASSSTVYTATFAPTSQGTCTISVAAGAYTDAVDNNNTATTFSVSYIPNFALFNNANNLEQTYIAGFLDVSGNVNHRNGDLNVMDGNLLVTSGNVSLNNGNLYVGGNGVLNSNLNVAGATTLGRLSVSNNMDVSGATTLNSALAISGLTSFNNNVSVSSNKTFTVGTGATIMGGSATMNSTLAVGGTVSMNSGLRVAGATTLTNAIMDGPVSVSGRVVFLNDISFTGPNIDICGNLRAQYPANSIPAAAIIGGISVVNLFNNDVSLSQTLSVGGATSLSTLATTGNATLRSTVGIVGATTMSALTTSGATTVGGALSVVGKAALTNDVSFNGSRIDISGNLYANYPANSIPLSAVVGGGVNPVFMTDVSVNAMLSVAGATTLQSTLVVSGQTTLANDISFNAASRIDICGNLYANYPANSIPSAAIIGGTTVASTFNTDVSMNSRLYVKENIKIGNLATISKIALVSQYGGVFTGTGSYGQSVSISEDGSILAIGASTAGFGQTMVYQKDTTNTTVAPIGWIQLGGTIIGEASGDGAGRSVSVSSDGTNIIVAIMAHLADGINGGDTGHVRVYQYEKDKAADTNQNNSTFGPLGWKRLGGDIDGEAPNDNQIGSGQVSLSVIWPKVFVAISAPMNDGTATIDNDYRGHVRVYQYVEGKAQDTNQNNATFGPLGWKRLGKDIDGNSPSLYSGMSVSLSKDGSLVAIGIPSNPFVAPVNRGVVRVYQYQSGSNSWTQYGADIVGQAAGDQFGMALSLSADGTILAVCANRNDSAGSESGSVYVYRYSAGTWSQLGSTITGEATLDQDIDYAKNVSVYGNWPNVTVAIGAQKNDGSVTNSNCGHVRIYRYIAATWTKLGDDIDGTTASDEFGKTVSLSSDGSTLAIGTQNGNYVKVYAISNNPFTSVLSTSGLQTAGIATISSTLAITGATTLSTMNATGAASMTSLNITGATTLSSTMTVSGSATIGGTLLVTGASSIGASTMNSTLSVGAATTMSTKLVANGNVSLNSTLTVGGATTMNSTLTVAGATTLNSTAFMTSLVTAGAVTQSTLYVAKSVTMNGDLDTSGVLLISPVTMPSTLTVAGAAVLSQQLSVAGATTMRSTLNTTGAVTIGGILSVAGVTTLSQATTMNGKVSVGGDVTMNTTLIVMNNATLASTLAVVGASTLSSTLYTSGSTTINNTLNVTGKTTFLNDVSFNNNVTTPNRLNMNNNRITIGSSNIQYNAGVSIDSAIIPSAMHTTNNATVGGVLTIAGSATLSSTLTVGGAVTSANVYASSNATLGSTLSVAGAATVGPLTVSGATTVSTLTTTGATTVGGTLGITGASTMATLNVYGPMRQW